MTFLGRHKLKHPHCMAPCEAGTINSITSSFVYIETLSFLKVMCSLNCKLNPCIFFFNVPKPIHHIQFLFLLLCFLDHDSYIDISQHFIYIIWQLLKDMCRVSHTPRLALRLFTMIDIHALRIIFPSWTQFSYQPLLPVQALKQMKKTLLEHRIVMALYMYYIYPCVY